MHFILADLHPGNILVALDPPPGPLLSSAAYMVDRFKPFGWKVPSSWREPAIVLLDVGERPTMARISPEVPKSALNTYTDLHRATHAAL